MKILVALVLCAAATAAASPQEDVLAVLRSQEAGWNAGDLEAYMDGYWRSEELRFASGGTVTRGWETTLARYRSRYPDRAAMGRLVFSDLDVTMLADDAAVVFGAWALERADDRPAGLFTLVFRRFDEGWRVVHDHTSAGAP